MKRGLNFTLKASKSGNPSDENGRPGSLNRVSPGPAFASFRSNPGGLKYIQQKGHEGEPFSELPATQVSAGCRVR